MRAVSALLIVAFVGIAACASFRPVNPDPRGILAFKGEPKQTHIEINDISLGPLHMFENNGVLLRPGQHRIVARADGFFPEYKIVEIKTGETTTLEVILRPIPD